jgi:hypothetical protein
MIVAGSGQNCAKVAFANPKFSLKMNRQVKALMNAGTAQGTRPDCPADEHHAQWRPSATRHAARVALSLMS